VVGCGNGNEVVYMRHTFRFDHLVGVDVEEIFSLAALARGRFRNEAAAHAGFERRELLGLLQERFSGVQLLTEEFLRYKYGERFPRGVLRLLLAPAIVDYSAPAHYAICRKRV